CLAFNLAPVPLFQEMRPASSTNLQEAAKFFAGQRARGGTVLQPAISAAYAYRDDDRPLNVVLLSDGMTEVGEQAELLRLIQSRPAGVRVFCIGVGNEVNRPLLEQMAQQAGGLAAFVSTEDSFLRQAQLMRQKLVRPAISDVVVHFEGDAVREVEPTRLGDLFYGTPLRLLGRYQTAGPTTVTLRGKIQGAAWEQTVDIDFPKQDQGNSEIERMWAQKRVERLLASERTGQGSHRNEIVRLSEAYSIVSPYASMLVLENDAEYKRWKIEQRNAVRIQRDRKSRHNLQQKLTQMRRRGSNGFELNRDSKLVSTNRPAQPTTAAPSTPRSTDQGRGLDLDINLPSGGGGGGAIDPITAVLALGTAGSAALAHRRRRRSQPE
ncbi:MAG: VWA domain-containing protein, partial [Pirellulales bacterium]|nr:VWA domain-containing protein [Pirellulales bacterium]